MGGGDGESFSKSGPKHLTKIDWTNQYHRTAVTSCLVQGVYTLEGDRQNNRTGTSNSRAEAWWKFFHFSLHKTFVDERDGSIRAAIFEYNYKNTNHSGIHIPHYVVAFRGTMLRQATWLTDLFCDVRCFTNLLHGETMMYIIAEIRTLVSKHGNEAIWLAGHSLGGSMALLAGKTMARSGEPLEAYIFNPPTALTNLKFLKSKKLKSMARFVGHLTRVVVVIAKGHYKGKEDELFRKLAAWKPNVYVNPKDIFCSEYINYFKGRERMCEFGLHVNLSTRYTGMNPFSSGGGETDASSEPLHILPSAYLMTNTTIWQSTHGVFISTLQRMALRKRYKAHQIRQWWDLNSIVNREFFQLHGLPSLSQ